MKRIITVVLALACLMGLAGCSGVSKEEYNSMAEQYANAKVEQDALAKENETLQHELSEKEAENKRLTGDYEALNSAYEQLKKDAEPFLQLTEDEKAAEVARAEKERIEAEEEARKAQEEADRLEEERKAAEEAERKAQEEARLAEEAKGYETGLTFKELSRSPDDYTNQKVKFTGRVLQIVDGSGVNHMRMSTSGDYDDVIYAGYSTDILDVRLLEDDTVTIYGQFKGLYSYETILGATVTLPYVLVDRIDLITED